MTITDERGRIERITLERRVSEHFSARWWAEVNTLRKTVSFYNEMNALEIPFAEMGDVLRLLAEARAAMVRLTTQENQ